jgi:hypothetical protein
MLAPILTLNCSCNDALLTSSQSLRSKGFRVLQTFDLHNTAHALEDCPCPHHTTSECDCQMVVLLVYGEEVQPATLILHGNNGKTWVSVPDTAVQPVDAKLLNGIRKALESLSSVDV